MNMIDAAETTPTAQTAFVMDFVERFYPEYDSSDEIFLRLNNFHHIVVDDFEEGDEYHRWLTENYADENNPKFRADYNQLLVEVYEPAIDNFLKIRGAEIV